MNEPSIGEMKTPVIFKSVTRATNENGVASEALSTVLSAKCRWVGAFGREAEENMRLNLIETATITVRYSALIDVKQRVYEGSDPVPWEIGSIDDVRKRHKWLEIKLKRTVKA